MAKPYAYPLHQVVRQAWVTYRRDGGKLGLKGAAAVLRRRPQSRLGRLALGYDDA